MPIVNGVNSDEFGREDVIRMYMVVQYMGGILTQFPVVPALDYDAPTGTLTLTKIQSVDAGSGTTQPVLAFAAADSPVDTRPGGSISFQAGSAPVGGVSGQILFETPAYTTLTLDDLGIDLQPAAGSVLSLGLGFNLGVGGGYPVMQADPPGGPGAAKLGFFGATTVQKPVVTGSRTTSDPVLLSLLDAMTALGLVTNSTTA